MCWDWRFTEPYRLLFREWNLSSNIYLLPDWVCGDACNVKQKHQDSAVKEILTMAAAEMLYSAQPFGSSLPVISAACSPDSAESMCCSSKCRVQKEMAFKRQLPVFPVHVSVLQSQSSSSSYSHYILCPEEQKQLEGPSSSWQVTMIEFQMDLKNWWYLLGNFEKHLTLQWSCSHHTQPKYFCSFVLGIEGTGDLLRDNFIWREQPLLIKAERRNRTGRTATAVTSGISCSFLLFACTVPLPKYWFRGSYWSHSIR